MSRQLINRNNVLRFLENVFLFFMKFNRILYKYNLYLKNRRVPQVGVSSIRYLLQYSYKYEC